MFTCPISSRGLVFSSGAVVASAEVGSSFRVFVFSEITIVPMAIRYFLHLVSLFG